MEAWIVSDPGHLPVILCGIFYGVLCVFSIVTGLIYMSGRRELNPLELSEKTVAKLSTEEKRREFAAKMGYLTFFVGIVQGAVCYALLKGGAPELYWLSLGFTVFSIASAGFKLAGKFNAFPLLKLIAYLAILAVVLLPATRALFF